MHAWIRAFSAAALLLPVPVAAAGATAGMMDVIEATYPQYSVAPPTPDSVTVCHGFGCQYRAEVTLSGADHARLAALMKAGAASAEAERQAIVRAGAWFDRHIAPAAGTTHHVARAGFTYMYDHGQFDCIDSSRNTTSLLLVLEELNLLRHHKVDVPVARGFLFDGNTTPHVTAVLEEKETGKKWAVDSWTRGYGEGPEIMPLDAWRAAD